MGSFSPFACYTFIIIFATLLLYHIQIARIESNGYVCHKESFNLTELIKQCLTAGEDIFIQKDIELICLLPEIAEYQGDRQLLKKVFDNLIINTLPYSTNNQKIIISINQQGSTTAFSIENTGIDIAKEELPKLFEAFYRPDGSRNRQTGGSGLGLYIVKKVLELHTSKYSLENSTNGVIFNIELL